MMENEQNINYLNPRMKLASVKVVMNIRKTMCVKNTPYSWRKNRKNPNKETKTTATTIH